jgi:glucosamine--fructose-6-phosphate aminotransferase (isomerizing)
MNETLRSLKQVLPRVERYRYVDRCAVIGRGYNYATAFEVALKIKELTSVVAESYSSADFRHGPIAIVRDGFLVIVVAPSGRIAPDMADLVSELKQRNGEIIVISDQSPLLAQAQLGLPIPPNIPEWLTPLITVIPGQCLALRLCEFKGMNVDQPIGLTKVTETL